MATQSEILDPVIVTGCARSFTSLVTGSLHDCGLQLGEICGPTPANRKGQFENRAIIQNCVKPMLKSLGADPMGQGPLPAEEDVPRESDIRDCILSIVSQQGVDLSRPWGFKAVKVCLLWPAFIHAFPNAKWVVTRRRRRAIAQSCLHTGFMKRYATEEDWLDQWVIPHEERLMNIKKNADAKGIWPQRMVFDGDMREFRDIVDWIGLEYREREVLNFVEPAEVHYIDG